MSAAEAVFYLLGGLAVASSGLVVTGRNPVGSLLFLVLAFFCLAGLFVTLDAHFVAAIQILVYAGAILVLFLFVIMLLNLGQAVPGTALPRPLAFGLTGLAGLAFVLLLFLVAGRADVSQPGGSEPAAPAGRTAGAEAGGSRSVTSTASGDRAAAEAAGSHDDATLDEVGADAGRVMGSTELIGAAMFRDFLLPFEVTSLLLLVAMVGAVILAKREP